MIHADEMDAWLKRTLKDEDEYEFWLEVYDNMLLTYLFGRYGDDEEALDGNR